MMASGRVICEEELLTSLKAIKKRGLVAPDLSDEHLVVSEEAENNAFSWISASSSDRLIKQLVDDVSWNNPESVNLMGRAFGVSADWYRSSFELVPPQFRPRYDYITLNDEQHAFWASQKFKAAMGAMKSDVSLAIRLLTEALGFCPTLVEALLERGKAFGQLNRSGEASSDFLAALKIDPKNVKAKELLLTLQQNKGTKASSGSSSSSSSIQSRSSSLVRWSTSASSKLDNLHELIPELLDEEEEKEQEATLFASREKSEKRNKKEKKKKRKKEKSSKEEKSSKKKSKHS